MTHAGSSPRSTRCAQKWHFAAALRPRSCRSRRRGTPACTRCNRCTRRGRGRRCRRALLERVDRGQIVTHGALSQWLQRRTAKCRRVIRESRPSPRTSPTCGSRRPGRRSRPCTPPCRRGSRCSRGGRSRSRSAPVTPPGGSPRRASRPARHRGRLPPMTIIRTPTTASEPASTRRMTSALVPIDIRAPTCAPRSTPTPMSANIGRFT